MSTVADLPSRVSMLLLCIPKLHQGTTRPPGVEIRPPSGAERETDWERRHPCRHLCDALPIPRLERRPASGAGRVAVATGSRSALVRLGGGGPPPLQNVLCIPRLERRPASGAEPAGRRKAMPRPDADSAFPEIRAAAPQRRRPAASPQPVHKRQLGSIPMASATGRCRSRDDDGRNFGVDSDYASPCSCQKVHS